MAQVIKGSHNVTVFLSLKYLHEFDARGIIMDVQCTYVLRIQHSVLYLVCNSIIKCTLFQW